MKRCTVEHFNFTR